MKTFFSLIVLSIALNKTVQIKIFYIDCFFCYHIQLQSNCKQRTAFTLSWCPRIYLYSMLVHPFV